MVYYENCCFCLKSETGVKVIGYVALVINAIYLLGGCIGYGVARVKLSAAEDAVAESAANSDDPNAEQANTMFSMLITLVEQYLTTCFISILISSLVNISLVVLLLLGIKKRNHCMMLPYMIVSMIGLVVSFNL